MTDLRRRTLSAAALGAFVLPGASRASTAPPTANVLRVVFETAETGFDPARLSDRYSATICAHVFEALYGYDPLAMPVRAIPLTAAAMPEVSADFRTWTVKLRPGIFFADDPAFGGRPRELVAQDYVYSYKRFYDPATTSPGLSSLQDEGLLGLDELRERALTTRRPLDYDAEVEGLRALDRYTIRFRLAAPRPRFLYTLSNSASYGALAREVVQAYGNDIPAHPVGTGPYRLKQWRRSSLIVLERNPGFREMVYDARPAADDLQGQAWLAKYRGRRLPLNDGVEVSIIEEGQSRWLAFESGQLDFVRVPSELANYAVPQGVLAPNLAKRGIRAHRYVNADCTLSWFNMEDPLVGGYTPEKVALRRAIGLAYDIDRELRIVRRGQAVAAQAPMPPGAFGYDPALRTDNSAHDIARSKALLDLYGYLDRDGDGWREQPDGRPLVLEMATQQSAIDRQFDELWSKSMATVGLRIRFRTAQWPENLKAARAGKLMMWLLGQTATEPDGQGVLEYMYGKSIGQGNLSRFKLPAFDAIYERMLVLPDGPERAALFIEASKLAVAYMPYRIHVHRVYTDLSQPWIGGYRQPLFRNQAWQWVEVDAAMRTAHGH